MSANPITRGSRAVRAAVELSKQRNPRYVAILTLVASVILIGGWLARPREVSQNPAPLPSETELAQLARRAERRSLDSLTKYFAGTAAEAETSVVGVPGTQVSGIVWSERLIVTAPLVQQASGGVTVATTSGEGRARAIVWGPHLPLSAVEPPGGLSGLAPAHRAQSAARPGDWMVAIWRTDRERAFAPSHFLQLASVTCGGEAAQEVVSSLTLTRAMAGGGLFDMDGTLLAVILPCNGRVAALAVSSVESILEHAGTIEQGLLRQYGLVVGAVTEEEQTYFKAGGGVIVREVWMGSRSEQAGLLPGDIIRAVGDAAVAKPEDLQPLTHPSESFELAVQRGSKTLTVALPAEAVAASENGAATSGAGLVWETPPRTYRIDSVIPGSRAAMAGVEPGDRVVRIDHAAPRNLAQLQRIFASDKRLPVFLELERGDRRVGILVR